MNNHIHLLGAHLSVSGGFFNAIENGSKIGCTAIQIFTKSNRQWASKKISQSEAELFIKTKRNSPIKMVIAHASYLINLGSSTAGVQDRSYHALVDEINRCHELEIPYLVLHPGTSEKDDQEATLEIIGDYINKSLKETPGSLTTVLIETMAGQGRSIGHTFEQIAKIISRIEDKNRIGVCFDTCHTFAAGYDFTSAEKYEKTFAHFDATIGLRFLKAFHINDSKKELNSRVDRHENIGDGLINIQAFMMIVNDARFLNVPKILETPHSEDLENDKRNLEKLASLLK